MIYGNVYSLIASVYPREEEGKPLSITVAADMLDFLQDQF
jgi:hypothetical protein